MLKQDKHWALLPENRQSARNHVYFLFGLIVTVGLLAGCTTSPQQAVTNNTTACIGEIQPVPEGLVAADDPELLQTALGGPMQGRLCKGQVFVARQPVLVYRGWNHANPNSLYGSWWTFTEPASTRAQYRVDYAICPSWNPLTRISVCQVKVGSKLVVGPGQSAACPIDQLSYAASPHNQVYLPNTRQSTQPSIQPSILPNAQPSAQQNQPQQQLLQVENCRDNLKWPEF